MKFPPPFSLSASQMGLTRRQFLAAGASALTLTACRTMGPSPTRAAVGTQLYGWTQYYHRAGRDFPQHLDEILNAIQDCGYDYAEGFLDVANPEKNADFAARLLKHGLRPVSIYTGGPFHDPTTVTQTVDRILAAAGHCQKAGFTVLNCNPDPIGRQKTDEELHTQVSALTELGRGLLPLGIRLGIHHHTPELENEAREFHFNFRHSPVGLVDFCYDVHWLYRGGLMPMDVLPQFGPRVVSWHLRQSRQQIWWEDLAPGDIDYNAIARYAREHRLAPLYTVELALEEGTKITRSSRDNHARSRAFVKETFGV